MKKEYLQKITKVLKYADPTLETAHRLEFKDVFGAVGGYVDEHIFMSCGKFGIALKLPPDTLKHLFDEKGVRKLIYFPKGHIKKDYAVLPERILKNRHALKELIRKSVDFVNTT